MLSSPKVAMLEGMPGPNRHEHLVDTSNLDVCNEFHTYGFESCNPSGALLLVLLVLGRVPYCKKKKVAVCSFCGSRSPHNVTNPTTLF